MNQNRDLPVLIKGGRFFDGYRFYDAQALLLQGGNILRFGPESEFAGVQASIVDNTGGTTLPGLFDCHVHLVFDSLSDPTTNTTAPPTQQSLRIQRNALAALKGGITTLRDLGTFSDREPALRDEIDGGGVLGPKIVTGGFMTISGGHGAWIAPSVQVDGEANCRRKVREYVALNLDWIKITASGGVFSRNSNPLDETFSRQEVAAIVDEASRFGRKVTAHALGAKGILNAVRAGIASIEHGFQLTDEIIGLMVERNIFLIPTFSASESLYRAAREGLGVSSQTLAKAESFAEMRTASFRSYLSAGGLVAMGTDAGTPFNKHGENAQELKHMTNRGMSNTHALVAATSNAAKLCDRPGGILADGAVADILMVAGDAERDIEAVSRVSNHRLVLKRGVDVHAVARDIRLGSSSLRFIDDTARFG